MTSTVTATDETARRRQRNAEERDLVHAHNVQEVELSIRQLLDWRAHYTKWGDLPMVDLTDARLLRSRARLRDLRGDAQGHG